MKTIRNETDKRNLLTRLHKLTVNEKALWGKMNVNQMVSHLVQACEMPFGHKLGDKGNFITKNIVKPLVLYVLPMPKEVKTSPEMSQVENGRKPEEFTNDLKKVFELINKIAALPENFQGDIHPVFGKLNAKEWALIAHKHTDHHLRQFGL